MEASEQDIVSSLGPGFGPRFNLAAEHPTCGAKTSSGEPCKRWPAWNRNRCKLHGGKSLRGWVHPNYVDGYYSRDPLDRVKWDCIRERVRMERFQAKVEQMRSEGMNWPEIYAELGLRWRG